MSEEVVPALAAAVEARRLQCRLSPTQFAEAAGISLQGLAPLRAGKRRRYQDKLKLGVTRALGWSEDSIDRLLRGENPIVVTNPPSLTIKDLMNPTGTTLELHEGRLASLEDDVRELRSLMLDVAERLGVGEDADVVDFPTAAHKGDPKKKKGARRGSRPHPPPPPEAT